MVSDGRSGQSSSDIHKLWMLVTSVRTDSAYPLTDTRSVAYPLNIAHRTPSGRAECQALADGGAGVFELDLMLAADDRIVVSHEVPLLTAVPWLRHDGPRPAFGRYPTGPPLEAVLDALPAGVEVLLDLKCDRGAEAARLVRRVLGFGLDPARCHVSSRNWASMRPLADAGFRTWCSIAHPLSLRAALEGRAAGYAVTVRYPMLTAAVVDRLHRLGKVMAWTVNDPDRARALVEAGVDGITSDRAEVFAALRSAVVRTARPVGLGQVAPPQRLVVHPLGLRPGPPEPETAPHQAEEDAQALTGHQAEDGPQQSEKPEDPPEDHPEPLFPGHRGQPTWWPGRSGRSRRSPRSPSAVALPFE